LPDLEQSASHKEQRR